MEQLSVNITAVGPLGVNCIILFCADSREGLVIDPGGDAESICGELRRSGVHVRAVLNTHGHFDHIGANAALLECTGAPLMIHQSDIPYLSRASVAAAGYGMVCGDSPQPSALLEQGQEISFGDRKLQVIHTPGHTPGGCCFFLPEDRLLLSGDTLFAESVGRTDLPGGSHPQLIASITEKLLCLGDDVTVVPGHGPSTTIGHERRYNPYLGRS